MKAKAGIVVDHKKVLNQLAELLLKEEECVLRIYNDPNKIEAQKNTLEIARSKTGEDFVVLIIGAFSSGKSSMINALIGEELLPTGFLPETAVLGELHYGEKKRITLYPKKGMWKGGDEPFDLEENTPEEIEKYVSLSSDDAINAIEEEEGCNRKIDSKFEKMVIYWPLDILKDGVVLVDSPGINDPYSNDYIVNSYLPHADAIVYVMDAMHAYQETDKNQLFKINEIGLNNIITGYTFYDVIVKQYRRKPEKLEKERNALISHMSKHSELGTGAVHFLDSMEGLQARMDNDQEAFRHSGYEGFETYLEQYLVDGKGRDQVKNMATTISRQAEIMIRDAEMLNSAALQDGEGLEKRISDAETQLNFVRTNSFNTGRNYRMRLSNYVPKAEIMTKEFIDKLPSQIDLEGFEPETELPDGARKLWPFGENGARKRAKAIQEECQHEIENRMNTVYKKWNNNELGVYLKNAVNDSTDAIRPDLKQIAKDLNDVNNTITGNVQNGNGELSNIALGLAYAMLTGDWFTGGMSAIYGKGAMAKGILAQAGVGFALGTLMAMGVTITLPVVAISAIGASIATILTDNNKKKVAKIKVQAVKSFRENFANDREHIDKIFSDIMANVDAYIDSASCDMESALAQDIKATEDSIKQIIEESKLDKLKKDERIKDRKEMIKELENLKANTAKICEEYNIAE